MKYYCIGIKGAGMSTLANILSDLGNEVIGYDDYKGAKFTEEGLNQRKIKIYYEGTTLDPETIVTYSKAFKDDHPEIKRVRELGLELRDYNQVVGEITKLFETIGVSGTHGKTTTSLLISHILKEAFSISYFIGDGTAKASADDDVFIIEADEYNKHFLAYYPDIALITSLEEDHLECYPGGLTELQETFVKFANKAQIILACGDEKNIKELKFNKKAIYYGVTEDNNVLAKNLSLRADASIFDLYIEGEFIANFKINLFGKHMVQNSLAAIYIARHYGVSLDIIQKALLNFPGAKRRFKESFYEDIVIIDDYAHHPTEIKVTIEAIRQKYPKKEVVAVFLPNTYSRTRDLFNDFVTNLSLADHCYLMEIESDREKAEDYPGVSSKELAKQVKGSKMISLNEVEILLEHENSVIAFMSCANISPLINSYLEALKNKKNK